MKKIHIIYLFAFLFFIISCGESIAEIKWEKDLESAKKIAKEKNLPIMIDVYTDWCTWCKELDEKTYKNKEVVKLSKKFVSLKINPETSEEGAKLAQQYSVQGFPTILFINADGFVLENVSGYVEGTNFLPFMNKAIDKLEDINKILKDNTPTLAKLDLYMEASKEDEAKEIYDTLISKNAIPKESMPKYILGFGLMKAQKTDYESANEFFNRVIKEYPESEEFYIAHYYKAVIMVLSGQTKEPKQYIEELLKNPDIPENMKAQYETLLSYINENK